MPSRFSCFLGRTLAGLERLGLVAFMAGLAGCQSVAVISTDPPGSEIYVGDKKLGVTPYEIKSEELGAEVAGGHLVQIRASGYSRLSVWIPAGIRGLDLAFNLSPFAIVRDEDEGRLKNSASRQQINGIAARLLKLQDAILQGDQESAKSLVELREQYPDIGSLLFLEAVVALNKSDKATAEKSLERAMALSPREYDFLALYNLVRSKP